MKASITKEVIIKGLEISLENEEEIKTFKTILTWASSWRSTQVNPIWEGLKEVKDMIRGFEKEIYQ